ncbi:LacI family DNA-binding transcriptional regulator [Georgenia ruanii]|uniref:LacI family DNA-binding transcriptional regulator n=1 Tax=Georgenia ruanii TaxID=348442 RepID=A0A7J9UUF8_9MICO|nr:LacI family DNA-binding transcriptional regulator [Georgenia ruanii]
MTGGTTAGGGATDPAGPHPEARTGPHPEARTGPHPEARTGPHPVPETGAHPVAETGPHPVAPERPRRRGVPTIYDVAQAAGVAPSTVSRTFSRPGRVNSETAARIRQVAAELGYRTNPMARALSTTHTSLLALVVPDITNPVFFEIINGVQDEAAEAGYTVVLVDSRESDRQEREALERALPIVEGIVLGTSRMSDASIRMIAKQRPMVAINRAVREIPSVVPDNSRGVRRALEHLGELGHDPVTYLAGPEASWADGMRWRGLREASLELAVHVRRLGPLAPTVAGGVAGAKAWLQSPTTGVIGYNDLVAIGFLRYVTSRGVRVPEDVSVVGYDNIFAADLVTPPLTTVATPRRALGAAAVRNLLAQIKGAHPRGGPPVIVPVKLVERQSTGPAPVRVPGAAASSSGLPAR